MRVTKDDVHNEIRDFYFVTGKQAVYLSASVETDDAGPLLPDCLELLTLCIMVLRNGFMVVGKSACADPAVYNSEIGKNLAFEDAVRQIWPLMGYVMRTRLHEGW